MTATYVPTHSRHTRPENEIRRVGEIQHHGQAERGRREHIAGKVGRRGSPIASTARSSPSTNAKNSSPSSATGTPPTRSELAGVGLGATERRVDVAEADVGRVVAAAGSAPTSTPRRRPAPSAANPRNQGDMVRIHSRRAVADSWPPVQATGAAPGGNRARVLPFRPRNAYWSGVAAAGRRAMPSVERSPRRRRRWCRACRSRSSACRSNRASRAPPSRTHELRQVSRRHPLQAAVRRRARHAVGRRPPSSRCSRSSSTERRRAEVGADEGAPPRSRQLARSVRSPRRSRWRRSTQNACCELLMARSEPIAEASLPDTTGAEQAGNRDGGDDADDGHDDEQFDEREALVVTNTHCLFSRELNERYWLKSARCRLRFVLPTPPVCGGGVRTAHTRATRVPTRFWREWRFTRQRKSTISQSTYGCLSA